MEVFKTLASKDGGPITVSWQASKTEAAIARKRLAIEHGWADVTTQTINVPTSKGPLVEWLNANVRA